MSDKTVVKAAKNVVESGEGVARNIWLAGLGLYSRTLEEAQQVNEKTTTAFDELVERGKEVEIQTKECIAKQADKAADESINKAVYKPEECANYAWLYANIYCSNCVNKTYTISCSA